MSWYTRCPFCNSKGDRSQAPVYFCTRCGFQWKSEVECQNLLIDKKGKAKCVKDKIVSECKPLNCPRLKQISLLFQGFSYVPDITTLNE